MVGSENTAWRSLMYMYMNGYLDGTSGHFQTLLAPFFLR